LPLRQASKNIAIGPANSDRLLGSGTTASGVAWPSAMLQVIAIPIIEQKRSENVPLILRLNAFMRQLHSYGEFRKRIFNHV
jgi:hypothetical protein